MSAEAAPNQTVPSKEIADIIAASVANKGRKDVVIYHSPCSDGFGAAWAAYKALGKEPQYLPASHEGFDPSKIEGNNCFLVDISLKLEQLLDLRRRFKNVVVLDHHTTNQKVLAEFGTAVFDGGRSGAGITWDSFHPGKPRPTLINYIEDQDLWKHKLPHSQEISCLTEIVPYDFNRWDIHAKLLENSFYTEASHGAAILDFKQKIVRDLIGNARMVQFAGYEVPAVNAPGTFKSELGNALAAQYPFAITWSQGKNGKFGYSLRSNGEVDVSKIAASRGGGGHKGAAGFISDTLLF